MRLFAFSSICLLLPGVTFAQDVDHVLFIEWGGNYQTEGTRAFQEVQRLDPDAVYVNFQTQGAGAVVAAMATNDFDQIWSYDLSTRPQDLTYGADIAAISEWYETESGGHVIADGRFLGSYRSGRSGTAGSQGRIVAENYYTNLMERGGGLMIATDHDVYANGGTNQLTAAIGLGGFSGSFGGVLPHDADSPLMTYPNVIPQNSLYNDTSTGQAPVGTLPNGLVLTAVAYHSGNTLTPGISSTFASSFNLDASITAPEDGYLLCPPDDTVTATATAVSEGDTGPVSYQWYSSIDGLLGDGESFELDAGVLSEGAHEIRVVATDRFSSDGDQITVQVGGDQCDDDGDGIINGEDQCPGFDDALDADGDGVPDDCDPCFGDSNDADADADGVCDDLDACDGDDAIGDTDLDGVCDDIDVCEGDDLTGDTDVDGVCDDVDICDGDDASGDSDVDGVCDDVDICQGNDSTGDQDGDLFCDDVDCIDTDPLAFPGAVERCNGLDDDCDDVLPALEADADGDGVRVCEDDCDDRVPTVFPGATELCDTLDNDCDDEVDEGFVDSNDDDILDCLEEDADGDGFAPFEGDCDDTDATVYTGAAELCDGIDNDCDGDVPMAERDTDEDGLSECEGDCDDSDATSYPEAPELCDDVDNNCDGAVDEDFADTNEDGVVDCLEEDGDGDGVTAADGDCDDSQAGVFPDAEELCDGIDTNCDGVVPEDEMDRDGDGFLECEDDCDDDDATVYPGAEEIGDGVDTNCDGELGEADLYLAGGCDCSTSGGPLPWAPLVLTGLLLMRRRRAHGAVRVG